MLLFSLNPNNTGFFVNPIQSGGSGQVLFYDTSTKEIKYGSASGGSGGTALAHSNLALKSNTTGTGGIITTGSIALGAHAFAAVTSGYFAGDNAIAIGVGAGQTNLHASAIAIGVSAGNRTQEGHAIAIGTKAGNDIQGQSSIAIRNEAGEFGQAGKSIAMGYYSGQTGQLLYKLLLDIKQILNKLSINSNWSFSWNK